MIRLSIVPAIQMLLLLDFILFSITFPSSSINLIQNDTEHICIGLLFYREQPEGLKPAGTIYPFLSNRLNALLFT